MNAPRITVAIPTLHAGPMLDACLAALARQRFREFEVVVVDNSGQGRANPAGCAGLSLRILRNSANAGYGAAVNQVVRQSSSEYVAVLNDDAEPDAGWLQAMAEALDAEPQAGMCASRVMLYGSGTLDSAGMLLCADGSSKQRGHGRPPQEYEAAQPALCPSGSAALYRRAMLEQTGGFEEEFFLYCEDTDLGLRAQWAGWTCIYVPDAVVQHHYSASAGRVSPLKAYLVERNRLYLIVRNFPLKMLAAAPWASLQRYYWHATLDHGPAAGFRSQGNSPLLLGWFVAKAHLAVLARLPRLLRQRWRIRRNAKIDARQFSEVARRYAIRPKDVAET